MSEAVEVAARALALCAWDRFNGRDSGFAQMKYPNGPGQYCDEQWPLYESDARRSLLAIKGHLIEKRGDPRGYGPGFHDPLGPQIAALDRLLSE